MDKASSITAALDAGKLPSTQQANQLIDWLNSIQPEGLSPQGRLLETRVREVLTAYKQLGLAKNGDNIVQEAIYHLTQGQVPSTTVDTDQAVADINNIRSALRSVLSILWSSLSSESSSLLNDLASFTRLSLADAAEIIEASAGSAKSSLRDIEKGVEAGERTNITGRSKDRVREEQEDAKVKWDHGVDAVKGAGDSIIDATRSVSSSVQETAQKSSNRVQDAYLKICDRAQSDPSYRDAITSLFAIVHKRLNQSLDSAAYTPDFSLSSFIEDPTPEQHVPKALHIFQTLLERLANTPLDPVLASARTCIASIGNDSDLRAWFDDFFELTKNNLTKEGYAYSDESKQKRKDLRERWHSLLEKDKEWKKAVESLKAKLAKFQDGITNDKDLVRLKEAHVRLGQDIERGLVEAGQEAETGLEALMERATWFWQDFFKVYAPRFIGMLGDLPIPRTEYKDSDIEFVLENLDISSLNLLPSHVYIRNITDVDIKTSSSPTSPSQTAIGTLTRIKIDALQLTLKDVSFWYKDLHASPLAPSEFTGLLALTLPPQGVSLDLKVRLIPHTTTGPGSREHLGHFHVVEHVSVDISEDVSMNVKESNHGVLFSVFKPIFVMRFREALEKTLAGQVRAAIEGADAVAWDVAKRREVFADTGIGGGAAVFAALWSEVGRFRRERLERGDAELGWRATGTGVVVEQQNQQQGGDVQFAMGVEPQILSGEKRGPLGTGSEPLAKRVGEAVSQATGVDVDIQGVDQEQISRKVKETAGKAKGAAQELAQEGKKRAETFNNTVQIKKQRELGREGWRSEAFDI